MSYLEGSNFQANKEDQGKPLFGKSKSDSYDNIIEKEVRDRLQGQPINLENLFEIFKQDFEKYRIREIAWGKVNETVKGLLTIAISNK